MSLDLPKLQTSRGLLPRLRRHFFTGLVIIAPTAISIWAAFWVVDKFDSLVIPWLPGAYNPDTYLPVKIPGFGLLLALILITLVGALGANLVGRTLIGWWDKALNSTPVVRSVYKGSKQIFETLFVTLPPRATISSAAVSRVRFASVPVSTKVWPTKVWGASIRG